MWPSCIEFSEAIQNPAICFTDSELKSGSPAVDNLGMPLVATGQFAAVFKLKFTNRAQAIRCFTRQLGDRVRRYHAINHHLNRCKAVPGISCLAQYEYDKEGILVRGTKYPILIMEWINGNSLDVHIKSNLKNKEALLYLAEEWVRLVKVLKSAQIAHGDLQHGNIIVQSDQQLKLVDFDGMYVPEMQGFVACELGHRDYQHPQRDLSYFNLNLDNFSSLSIYVSILALANQPELWDMFHDEGLIFKQADYKNPSASACFKSIKDDGNELQKLVALLKQSCEQGPASTPFLGDLVNVASKKQLPPWMLGGVANVKIETREAGPNGTSLSSTSANPRHTSSTVAPNPTASTQSPGKHQSVFLKELGNGFGIFLFPWLLLLLFNPSPDAFVVWTTLYFVIVFFRAIYKNQPNNIKSTNQPQAISQVANKPTYVPAYSPIGSTQGSGHKTPTVQKPTITAPSGAATAILIGSTIRLIYHQPSCKWARRIAVRNRKYFSTLQEAHTRGYRRCRVCSPP